MCVLKSSPPHRSRELNMISLPTVSIAVGFLFLSPPPRRRACPSHIGLSKQLPLCCSGLSFDKSGTRVDPRCANRGKSEFVHYVRECARRGYRGRPESPLNKSHSIRLFAGGLRKNGECILRRGTPSLAGRPLFQTVHRTV